MKPPWEDFAQTFHQITLAAGEFYGRSRIDQAIKSQHHSPRHPIIELHPPQGCIIS